MPAYEVKAWVTVTAPDEESALELAAAVLDSLPEEHRWKASIEGEGAVYEVEDEDEDEDE